MTDGIAASTLRPAQLDDLAVISEIWYAGWCDGHLGNVPDELIAARPRESFDTRAAAQLEQTIVATIGDAVAGFVMIIDDEVEQVYVARDHRGSGIAAPLLAAAEQRVLANGYRQAWLAVVAGNGRARKFYDKNGWSDEGPFTHHAPGPDGPVEVPAHRYVKTVLGVTSS